MEIQAIAELYNRPVEVYNESNEPMNLFQVLLSPTESQSMARLRLSYHSGMHYNSVHHVDDHSIGVGLGLPGLRSLVRTPFLLMYFLTKEETNLADKRLLDQAIVNSDFVRGGHFRFSSYSKETMEEAVNSAMQKESDVYHLEQTLLTAIQDESYIESRLADHEQEAILKSLQEY